MLQGTFKRGYEKPLLQINCKPHSEHVSLEPLSPKKMAPMKLIICSVDNPVNVYLVICANGSFKS